MHNKIAQETQNINHFLNLLLVIKVLIIINTLINKTSEKY